MTGSAPRVAVFGAGGVGGYLAGRLVEAGESVAVIARGEHLRAIREHGLHLESIAGDVVARPAVATSDPGDVGPVECVIVATKTWQLPEAARQMKPLVGDATVVLPVLNGVDAPEVLAAELGEEHVVGGLSGMFSFIAGPAHIKHVGAEPWVTFGELRGGTSERLRRIEGMLQGCRGLKVHLTDDIRTAMWEKFMFITATGGVGAVTRSPYGVFRAVAEARAMVEAAMLEVVRVARAHGIGVSEEAVPERMRFVDALEPHGTSSMQRDIAAGKRSELDAWNGAVVRLGREVGVETPVNAFIHAALLPQELVARSELASPDAP